MQSEEDVLAFIRGECSSLKNEEDRGLLEGLKEAWNDPKNSADEKWLIDFFVNERCVGLLFCILCYSLILLVYYYGIAVVVGDMNVEI